MKLKVQVDNPNILFEFVSVGVGYAIVSQKTLEKKSPEWRFKTVQLNDPWAQRKLKIFLPQTKDCESDRDSGKYTKTGAGKYGGCKNGAEHRGMGTGIL